MTRLLSSVFWSIKVASVALGLPKPSGTKLIHDKRLRYIRANYTIYISRADLEKIAKAYASPDRTIPQTPLADGDAVAPLLKPTRATMREVRPLPERLRS